MIEAQDLYGKTINEIMDIADACKEEIASFDRSRIDPTTGTAKKMFAAKEGRLSATRSLYGAIDMTQTPECIAIDLARLQGIESEIVDDMAFLSTTDDFRKECLASITVCGQVIEELTKEGYVMDDPQEGEHSDG